MRGHGTEHGGNPRQSSVVDLSASSAKLAERRLSFPPPSPHLSLHRPHPVAPGPSVAQPHVTTTHGQQLP
jgi:hypothetical protein